MYDKNLRDSNLNSVFTFCAIRGQYSIFIKFLFAMGLTWDSWTPVFGICMTVVDLCSQSCTIQMQTKLTINLNKIKIWTSPIVFLFSAGKQNKAEAGGTQSGIGTLHIVLRTSSSTFLGWLGSGPPVQEYCSNSSAPQTWPQQPAAASTGHCGA